MIEIHITYQVNDDFYTGSFKYFYTKKHDSNAILYMYNIQVNSKLHTESLNYFYTNKRHSATATEKQYI